MISRENLRVLLNIHWPSWRNLAGSVAADSLVLVGRACGPCAPIHSAIFDPRNWHRCGKYQASCLIYTAKHWRVQAEQTKYLRCIPIVQDDKPGESNLKRVRWLPVVLTQC